MRSVVAICIAIFGLHYFPNIWTAAKLNDSPSRGLELLVFASIGMFMFCHAILLALGIAPAMLLVLTLFISIIEMWVEMFIFIDNGYATSLHFAAQLAFTVLVAAYFRPCFIKEYPNLAAPDKRRKFDL
jgi:hypothetical protein